LKTNFFRPSLDPARSLPDEKDGTVEAAIENQENIMVFDYDVDGTTGITGIFLFKTYYPNVAYIPDRYDEGYGISFKG
jgi:single-stranded-DNA-specific exonuclease